MPEQLPNFNLVTAFKIFTDKYITKKMIGVDDDEIKIQICGNY